ncbi:SDR family oxidoreductase [Pseudonocardia kujensis]|uniref:SDR family oxidoreductase n=1 Tax=Pseudonocardia kujensis TaxID=1128675 RepID=UPI001E4D99D9|nr:SDR family NAD(P)-dependent oxidoreductase [Pseudonocardia kujensis]MCE0764713.1 SDR family oxidoreductase [Pseudonocardia kujensis]
MEAPPCSSRRAGPSRRSHTRGSFSATGGILVRSDSAALGEVAALADRVRAELGGIDLLFLNAGISATTTLVGTEEQTYDELFAVNTKGPYFTVQGLAPLIADGGAIVLTTSAATR